MDALATRRAEEATLLAEMKQREEEEKANALRRKVCCSTVVWIRVACLHSVALDEHILLFVPLFFAPPTQQASC